MNSRDCWLSFSLTPVQGFIQAARTVRDLKTGSTLLCYLVGEAIEAGWAEGGELLFPALQKGLSKENIPNQFVMIFDTPARAEKAAFAVEQRVRCTWETLGDKVRQLLRPEWQNWASRWDEGWDDQLKTFWDIQTIVLCRSADHEVAYRSLFNLSATQKVEPLSQQWKLLAAGLNAAKQVRHFPADQGIGRHKCTMMGDLEQMGPGGTLKQQTDFWKSAVGFSWQGIRIGTRDRLCAVSLVKRFVPLVSDAPPLKKLTQEVMDTAFIATSAWRQEATTKGLGQDLDAFQKAAKDIRNILKEEGETPGRYLLDDRLDEKDILAELPADRDKAKDIQVVEAVRKLRLAHGNLRQGAKKAEMDAPPRYFAIIALDGDQMGKRLSGDFCEDGELTGAFYADMSSSLRNYAEKDVPRIVSCHHGQLVYAGGDDALALVPLSEALLCGQMLRKAFPVLPGSQKPATASGGIVICHYMHDLRDALRKSHAVGEAAKDFGRDACGVHLLKRSGGDIRCVLSWALLRAVTDLAGLFRAEGSDRWVSRLDQILPAVNKSTRADQVQVLLTHFIQRTEGGSESVRATLVAQAQTLWSAVWKFWEERKYEMRKVENSGFKPQESPDFWREALVAYLDAVKIASFIARGRE